mmetsp:Transcript_10931/g.29980  ORF Transcript_10931/g.29980 Transcript_10931/m.29980 type:complete len:1056 (-) Transcript_10931:352-3519(-)|eukprot:CAMPEP_0202374066 /NCGR_PEP_ID=MMETSP1127-20130417/4979_1 /ASSEMBLY_ACC=CAM_ASM_000462 /TAXON_ID=3047 /ORGANISM="Dunaliella tertiolecta, Strain CCMP1320" /LENGTH=1055 /DNA_ID=CAMNT_0048971133 /DNA_START=41 /DNA_END=3208 /DNA_ORIENTATION=+
MTAVHGNDVANGGGQLPVNGLVKPRVDTFSYRFLTLSNGLRALLVCDPEADKAACSCDVSAGSLLDPDDFLGLAHFLEHMLFYSSAKYPVEDEYSKFITDHGGHTNAYTSAENTNYQFDINWEHLEPALDRFAQFFIAPLISADGVDREINAVDSENGKNLQLDMWRQLQLSKHTSNKAHPWSKFSTGSLETLGRAPRAKGLDIREAVVAFHQRYYSANIMKVVVMGRQSLDELEAMVRSKFEAVSNTGLSKPEFSSDVFLPEHRSQVLKVVPVKEGHSIDFMWQVPPSTPLYRKAPLNYLSHLLGHEGEGSVFALLKARGLASSLVAGESGASIQSASFFYVRVELTEEGKEHVPEIGAIIFRYLAMLEQEGIQKSIYDEVEALQRLRFDYRDKMSPFAYTTALSSAMQTYPDEDLLLALYHVPQEYDPESIKATLKEMSVDKVRVMWASKTLADEAQETEPWYGTKYALQPIPEEWVQAWKQASQSPTDCAAAEPQAEGPRLHLPEPNPFVPTDLSLKTEEASAFVASGIVGPQLIEEQPGVLNLWHRCDLTFPTPKAVVLVDFQAPEAYASPEAAVCTRLFVKLVADALNELAYPADLAGLVYGVTNSQAGFQVALSGYNHKLPVLLEAVLKQLSRLKVKADRFSLMVEQLKKEYSNIKYSQPYSWVMYRRELLLNFKRWQVAEYAEVIDTITPQVLEAFLSTRLFSRCYVDMMCVGNVAEGEARAMGSLVKSMLQDVGAKHVLSSQMRDMRTIRVPAGDTTLLEEPGPNPENKNSAVSIMYQVGPDELRTNALLQLLVHMSKRDAFNTLRTQQQLGYIVALFNNHELGIHHIEFVIQSTSHSVPSLCTRVEAFVQQLCTELLPPRCGLPPAAKVANGKAAAAASTASADANGGEGGAQEPYSDREFRKAVEELVKSKLEKPKRLGELATRWWNEIKFCTLEFARQEQEVEVLRTLSPTDLIEFANTMLLLPQTRRKAVVAAHAAEGPAAEAIGTDAMQQACAATDGHSVQVVEDISEYKRSCDVWPNVGAYHSSKRKQRELAERRLKAKPQ